VKRYSGRTPCCAGIDQFVFDLPPDTPTGCYVPVTIRAGGVLSNDTTLSISTDGQACSDPAETTSAALRQGGKLGAAVVVRDRRRLPSGGTVIADIAFATFSEESGGPWAYHPDYVSPPPGTCLVSARRGALYETSAVYGGAPSVRSLNAGEQLTIVTGAGDRVIPQRSGPHPGYLGYLGPLETDFDPASVLLNASGAVRLTSAGGADLGGFNVTMQMPSSPNWNLAQTTIDRSQPLTLTWSGAGENDQVWVTGGASDPAQDAAVVFSCSVPMGQNSFTVGTEVLSRLPATLPASARVDGFLSIAARRPSALSIDGLNGGTVSAVSGASTSVEYQ
jgi:hypothetical protein